MTVISNNSSNIPDNTHAINDNDPNIFMILVKITPPLSEGVPIVWTEISAH